MEYLCNVLLIFPFWVYKFFIWQILNSTIFDNQSTNKKGSARRVQMASYFVNVISKFYLLVYKARLMGYLFNVSHIYHLIISWLSISPNMCWLLLNSHWWPRYLYKQGKAMKGSDDITFLSLNVCDVNSKFYLLVYKTDLQDVCVILV
jgi:hypothetical protein